MFATSGLGYEFKICGYDLVTESWYKLLRKMFRLWWLQGNAPIRLDFFHRSDLGSGYGDWGGGSYKVVHPQFQCCPMQSL